MTSGPHRSPRGQAIVEFSLVLPYLLLILIAIIDLGFYYCDVIGTQSGLRAGARAALETNPDGSACHADSDIFRLIDEAHGPSAPILPEEVVILRVSADPEFGGVNSVTVSIDHVHTFVFPFCMPVDTLSRISCSMRARTCLTLR